MITDHHLPAHPCPVCSAVLDAATNTGLGKTPATVDIAPQPGDLTICMYCASVLCFGADGLHALTATEAAHVREEESQTWSALCRVRNAVQRRRDTIRREAGKMWRKP